MRLRGIPFTATKQDVFAFFAKHDLVECIADGDNAVEMILKPNGKPSGQAVVRMLSVADTHVALQTLNGQYLGTRYIEVFQHVESEPQAGEKREAPGPAPVEASMEFASRGVRSSQVGSISCEGSGQDGPFDGAGDTGGSGIVGGHLGCISAGGRGFALNMKDRPFDLLLSQPPVPADTGSPLAEGDPGDAQQHKCSWEALYEFLGPGPKEPSMPPAAAWASPAFTKIEGMVPPYQ